MEVWAEIGKFLRYVFGHETNSNSSEVDASAAVFSRIAKSATAREASSSAALSSVISSVSSRASQSASHAAKLGQVTESPKVGKKEERDQITSLLASWRTKFASSAEDAFGNLKEEINEISSKATKKADQKDVLNLKAQTEQHLAGLRHDINKIIHSLPENPSEKEKSAVEARITTAIRATGEKIRDETAAVRSNAREFENKLYDDVSEATQKHLGALDATHDFGLQEIGMKWTGMNYVTQKDWKHFNDLRTENKKTIEKLIESARFVFSNPSFDYC